MPATTLGPASLARGTVLFEDGAGRLHVTVVVKATYALRPGGLATPAPPSPLDPDADLAPCKPRADVMVLGRVHARSPGATRQAIGFSLARGPDVLLRKRLVAVGDRTQSEPAPAPLKEVPLAWEGTWGGRDNPVGSGLSEPGGRLPNLLDPDAPGCPAGLGAIPAEWFGRASRLTRAHEAGLRAAPMRLADDLDLRFFQIAPRDQQLPRLLGGEQILLVGVHPRHPVMRCRLPALHAFAQLEGAAFPRCDVALAGDTLWIDAERGLACVTFRGSVPVEGGAGTTARAGAPWIVHAGMAPCEDVERVLGAPRAWSAPAAVRAASPTVDPLALHDESGFASGAFSWSAEPPRVRRVVAIKGTFVLAPRGGKPALSAEQDPLRGDEPEASDASDAIDHASDHVPFKARADVLLRGTAHAAAGRTTAVVGLTLGSLTARLVALGPRAWDADGHPGPAGPFAPVALRWKHAFGGPGFAANPAGTGFVNGTPPPLLEDPERLMRARGDRPAPCCFAPIAPAWPARSALLGTFGRAWQRERWPHFPADFNPAFFQAAPPSLRCDPLRGDEAFLVESVRPDGGNFTGALPGVRPRAFAVRREGDPFEVLLRLDTVLFDTDRERLFLTWRGSFEIDGGSDVARVVILREALDAPRSMDDVAAYLTALAEPRLAPELAVAGAAASGSVSTEAQSGFLASEHLRAAAALSGVAAGLFAARAARADALPAPAPPPPPTRAQVEALVRDGKTLRGRDLSGADLRGIDLSGQDLEGAILAGAQLGGARLAGAKLAGVNLSAIDAADSIWDDADLSRADLTGARLARAGLSRARLTQASFAGAALAEARLDAVHADGASFAGATLTGCHADGGSFKKADLSGAALASASLRGACLDDATLNDVAAPEACFDEASLKDARLEKARLGGCSFRGAKAAGAVWECADLTRAVLQGADASGAIFAGASLVSADLGGLSARAASFRGADLTQAKLDGADLMQASFEGACLRGASLRGASLYQAETYRANVEGADLSKALLAGTKLAE